MDGVSRIVNKMNKTRFKSIAKFWHYYLRVVYACDIMPGLKLGNNVRFAHNGLGVIINQNARIGNNVNIGGNVVIGGRGKKGEAPNIEDNVLIGAGVLLLGGITIGHDSKIGAGSVVLKDIPPFSVAVGNPACVIKTIS